MPPTSIPPPTNADVSSPASGGASPVSVEPDFSQRADLVEMMDQPCSYEELRACLQDIGRVNRLTFGYRPTISWMEALLNAHPPSGRPLRIVDVGCGDGEMLRQIDAWAAKRGIAVALTGIDLNPDAIRAARETTSQRIEWIVGDALTHATTAAIDVVLSSLLTHHLTDSQVVRFLQWMELTAQRGWFINDLHRQRVPYRLFRLMARFTTWHPFVKNDGAVSILRSFVVEDWQRLCAAAGLAPSSVSIKELRPARLCVGRVK